jgi:predicted phosphodiesterase
LSMQQLSEAVALFELEKPEIVITHDCPMQIREKWFEHRNFNRTVQAMTAMFHNHQPESWCFGHHHRFVEEKIDGTNFMCLAELQSKKIGSQKVYLGEDEP